MKRAFELFASLALFAFVMNVNGCSSGCMKCEGITATRMVCKGDFQQTDDFSHYIEQYRAQGGVCEED